MEILRRRDLCSTTSPRKNRNNIRDTIREDDSKDSGNFRSATLLTESFGGYDLGKEEVKLKRGRRHDQNHRAPPKLQKKRQNRDGCDASCSCILQDKKEEGGQGALPVKTTTPCGKAEYIFLFLRHKGVMKFAVDFW